MLWISTILSFCEISFQLFIQGYRSSNDASNVKYVHVIFMNHLGKFFYKIWDRFITVRITDIRKQIDRVVLTEVWTIGNQRESAIWCKPHLLIVFNWQSKPFCTLETNSYTKQESFHTKTILYTRDQFILSHNYN